MPILSFKSPLNWPEGVPSLPRNNQRADHGFAQMTLAESVGYLDEELAALPVTNAVLWLDMEQPLVERLRKKVGSRTGACLHFKYQARPYVLTCDRWQLMEHNIYALHLAFRHLRNIERWGVGSIQMLLAGFETNHLPESFDASEPVLTTWMELLGLGPTATLDDAVAVYHRRARQMASDPDALSKLNILMEEVRHYFADKTS